MTPHQPERWRMALFLLAVAPFVLWFALCFMASRLIDWRRRP